MHRELFRQVAYHRIIMPGLHSGRVSRLYTGASDPCPQSRLSNAPNLPGPYSAGPLTNTAPLTVTTRIQTFVVNESGQVCLHLPGAYARSDATLQVGGPSTPSPGISGRRRCSTSNTRNAARLPPRFDRKFPSGLGILTRAHSLRVQISRSAFTQAQLR